MTAIAVLQGMTDTQAILGCAGMSSGDISDARLMASQIEDDLMLIMFDRLPEFETLWQLGSLPDSTPEQKRVATAISTCAKWEGAALMASRWLTFKQLVTDGKVRNDRFGSMDLKEMQANIEAGRLRAWGFLLKLMDPDNPPTVAVPNFFGKVTPLTDPVTDTDI